MYLVRIGKILTQKGLISDFQLQQALQSQRQSGQKVGEILIQQGLISRLQLQQILIEQRCRNLVACSLLSLSTLGPTLALTPPKTASNCKFKNLRGVGPCPRFWIIQHKLKQMLPTVKEQVFGQSLDIVKEALSGSTLFSHALIRGVHQVQNGVK